MYVHVHIIIDVYIIYKLYACFHILLVLFTVHAFIIPVPSPGYC